MQRCQWIEGMPDFYVAYHDTVWGKPEHCDHALFRWLILEMFHIGLSWQLILSKQAGFDSAFDQFDVLKIAEYKESDIQRLMADTHIIRHRKKIEAAIANAKAFIAIQKEYGTFDQYIWSFTKGQTIIRQADTERLTTSPLSDEVTKSLKAYGFKFIGSVTIYSYLQAIGVINDHDAACDFK